ncbi:VOC family protein [Nocardia sp. CDC153]|uniref:VOC family protein n=1 Tax=Nocardia sp. CDC153 TaxID=3112167 RepID=UPI002DBE0356|nr:VOC family protein [Nocardia sp. CDC153]MEC3958644.1 VOC family protein [Nocardia sp. CDC153]
MNWTLEVVIVPVSDVDRAKDFYANKLGFHVDHDVVPSPGMRICQLTPPGSGCSIVIGAGGTVPKMEPGYLKGLQLVVPDLRRAHAELVERGVDVSDIQVLPGPPSAGDPLDNAGFVFFDDPDGNSWAIQQISNRA